MKMPSRVPVNTLLTSPDFRYVVDDCGARITIVDPQIVDPSELSSIDTELWTVDQMRKRVEAASPRPSYAETHRDAMAFFLYSSGTTGEPKGVVHLQHDMWICCETYGSSVLQIRVEATNVLNFVNLSNPGLSLNAPATFGKIRTARDMRRIQLGARLSF